MMQLAVYWPKQLTYPIERWPVPARLSNLEERKRFVEALVNEAGIRGACRAMGMAHGSVYRYLAQNKDFKAEVYAVCEFLPLILQEEAREIADAALNDPRRSEPSFSSLIRTKVDVRMRTAGHHKTNVEVNVDNRTQTINVSDPERAKLIELREKALAKKQS